MCSSPVGDGARRPRYVEGTFTHRNILAVGSLAHTRVSTATRRVQPRTRFRARFIHKSRRINTGRFGGSPAIITSDCASRTGGHKMSTTWKSDRKTSDRDTNDKENANQATSNTFSGTPLSSWSRQQKFAMATIAGYAILGLLLILSACSKQASKPALVGASSPAATSATLTIAPTPAPAATIASALAKKAPRKRPANVTYTDADSGVSFLYPRKFALASGDKAQPQLAAVGDMPMNFVQPGGIAIAIVAVPADSYPGTDFSSAFFSVNVNRSVSEQECTHFAFVDTRNPDGEPVDAERVKIGATDMEMTSDFSAGAATQAEAQYYHSYENGACYEYVLGLGTAGYGIKDGIKPVDRDEVFAKLEKILATVTIKTNVAQSEHVAEQVGTGIVGGKE